MNILARVKDSKFKPRLVHDLVGEVVVIIASEANKALVVFKDASVELIPFSNLEILEPSILQRFDP